MVVSIQFSTVKKGQHGCHMCSVASFSRPTRRSRYASSVQLDAMASLLHEHHVRHNHLCPSSNYKCHCTSSLFTSTLCTGIKKKQQQRNEINKRDKQYSYKYVSLSSPPKHFWAIWRVTENYWTGNKLGVCWSHHKKHSVRHWYLPQITCFSNGHETIFGRADTPSYVSKQTYTLTKAWPLDPLRCLNALYA